ncbi:MAG: hypothetical protein WCI75_21035 [candidate division NC10 bacterium]
MKGELGDGGEALLSLVTTVTLSPGRRRWSGLVEQQALFHRRPSP